MTIYKKEKHSENKENKNTTLKGRIKDSDGESSISAGLKAENIMTVRRTGVRTKYPLEDKTYYRQIKQDKKMGSRYPSIQGKGDFK